MVQRHRKNHDKEWVLFYGTSNYLILIRISFLISVLPGKNGWDMRGGFATDGFGASCYYLVTWYFLGHRAAPIGSYFLRIISYSKIPNNFLILEL